MNDFAEQAQAHIDNIVKMAEAGQITWREETTPRPDAMRAFTAFTGKFNLMVCQANMRSDEDPEQLPRLVYEAMATTVDGGVMLIRIPNNVADKLYHIAVASRN